MEGPRKERPSLDMVRRALTPMRLAADYEADRKAGRPDRHAKHTRGRGLQLFSTNRRPPIEGRLIVCVVNGVGPEILVREEIPIPTNTAVQDEEDTDTPVSGLRVVPDATIEIDDAHPRVRCWLRHRSEDEDLLSQLADLDRKIERNSAYATSHEDLEHGALVNLGQLHDVRARLVAALDAPRLAA